MISKTIGFRGVPYFQTHQNIKKPESSGLPHLQHSSCHWGCPSLIIQRKIPAANWRPKWKVQAPFEESRDCTHGNMVAESACHTNAEKIMYIYIYNYIIYIYMLKVSLKRWNGLYFQIVPEWLVDCWLECAMWQVWLINLQQRPMHVNLWLRTLTKTKLLIFCWTTTTRDN